MEIFDRRGVPIREAEDIRYDDSTSLLVATDVQAAIDELSLILAAGPLSVLGRAVNSPGYVADISAVSDGQVLLRNGSALAFTAPTAPAAGFTISTGLVFALADDLAAVEGLGTTGVAVRTGTSTWTTRTNTGTSNRITVTNGDGVAGAPTYDISATYVGQTSITTLGTITTGVWNGTTVDPPHGGTGVTTVPTNGQLLVGNGTTYTVANLGSGTGISTTTGAGTLQINNTGVTSITGTTNQVIASAATGAVTLSLPQSINTTATPTFNQVTVTNAPALSTDAVNKAYADALITGLSWKQAVVLATTANIALTGAPAIDGFTPSVGDRVLVKNQSTPAQNGIYVAAAGAWSRSADAATAAEINNASVAVQQGTINGDTAWLQTATVTTLGTDPVTWVQFVGTGTYTAGTGITLTGTAFSLTAPVTVPLGGTGTTSAPTNGQLLIGNGTTYTLASLTAPAAGISITGGAGTITFALTNDLLGVEGLSTNGLATRTAANTWTTRAVTGTSGTITVTNGDGVSGAPTITIDATYVGQTSITTLGTITTGTWNGTAIAYANIANATGLSVLGRSANSSGVLADIVAGSDGDVLRRSGTSIGFGSITLAASNFANPTNPGVNITGSNGSAVTAMRSDAVLVLDQTITPNMTGTWQFTNGNAAYFGLLKSDAALVTGLVTGVESTTSKSTMAFVDVATNPAIRMFRINGSFASPTALANGGTIAAIRMGGYDGTSAQPRGASIVGVSNEAWTSTARGAEIKFEVTTTGTTTNVFALRTGSNATGGFTQVLDGVLAQPGLAFISDAATGRYLIGAGNMADVCSGASIVEYGTNYADIKKRPRRTNTSSPSAFASGSTNNLSVAANISVLRGTPNAANSTITGITNGTAGDELWVFNIGTSGDIIFTNDDAGSTAANRFFLASATSTTVKPSGCAMFWYDGTSSRWRQLNRIA